MFTDSLVDGRLGCSPKLFNNAAKSNCTSFCYVKDGIHWTIREMILVRVLPLGEHSLVRNISKKRKRVWHFTEAEKKGVITGSPERLEEGWKELRKVGAQRQLAFLRIQKCGGISRCCCFPEHSSHIKVQRMSEDLCIHFFWVRSLGAELLSDV